MRYAVSGKVVTQSPISCIKNINFQTVEWSGIKFPEARSTGVWLRSQRMKLPPGVGQRKTKAIEQELKLMNIGKYNY